MLSRKTYPVRCECGWPIEIVSDVRGLSFVFVYRSGGINGREVQRCPGCRELVPLSLVLDFRGDRQQGEAAA